MDLNTLKIDPSIGSNGVWFDYADARILIASNQSPTFRKAIRKAFDRIPSHKRNDPKETEPVTAKVAAEHICLNWENMQMDGKPFEPTIENRVAAMKIPAFAEWVFEQSNNLANFQHEDDAKDEAALKSPSPMGSSLEE